jgi:ketosteroid isomerase-like protein
VNGSERIAALVIGSLLGLIRSQDHAIRVQGARAEAGVNRRVPLVRDARERRGRWAPTGRLLDYYVDRYNTGDLDAVMDLYAEDAVQIMPDGIFKGRDAIRDRLALELIGFSDVHHTVTSFVEQGDTFADEWIFRGAHTGPFPLPDSTELPPTGKRVEMRGMELVQVRNGKIVVDNLYYDNLSSLVQLGLVPGSATA